MSSYYWAMLALLILTACQAQTPPPVSTATVRAGEPVALPQYNTTDVHFEAQTTALPVGDCTALVWEMTESFVSAHIAWEGGYFPVEEQSGSLTVCPTQTMPYSLQVEWPQETRSRYVVDINVSGPSIAGNGPTADFYIEPSTIDLGQCTAVNWAIEGDFEAAYLTWEGERYLLESAYGYLSDCPSVSQPYTLAVEWADHSIAEYEATVQVQSR